MAHLVFIPTPGAGHIFAAVELAKLLVERERRLSVSILIMTFPDGANIKITSLASSGSHNRVTYVHLSCDGFTPDPTKRGAMSLPGFLGHHKPQIRDFLAKSTCLAGIVFDLFCLSLAEVADEIGVPTYVFCASGAGFLCLVFHGETQDLSPFKDSDAELVVPGFLNPVPAKVLPADLTGGEWSKMFLSWAAKCKKSKGIFVNTFFELQSHAVTYLLENDTLPPIYPVGPILNLKGASGDHHATESNSVISWLDDQPKSSVVFICFGSGFAGTVYDADQVAEIAMALENSGTRFLWAQRRPVPKSPGEYEDLTGALPKEFLEKTAEIGKVVSWAPQTAVLSHSSVRGFITHCGWNSCLESIWYGVPVATWPLCAEQHSNAFELVKELGIGVELKTIYKKGCGVESNYLVTAEEIEKAMKQLEEISVSDDNLIKRKVKDMSKKSRMAVAKGGSSYAYLDRFIEGLIANEEET